MQRGSSLLLFDQYITKVQFQKRPDHSIDTRTVSSYCLLPTLEDCTEVQVHSARFLSGGFTTMAVMNPQERILAKHISVDCHKLVHGLFG